MSRTEAPQGTGDCYLVAGRIVSLDETSVSPHLRLCHGTPVGQGPLKGKPVPHAWVELSGDTVIDRSNGLDVAMRREKYYEIGQIKEDEVRRYTKEEALEHMLKSGHYGPWEEEEE